MAQLKSAIGGIPVQQAMISDSGHFDQTTACAMPST
jgi:hypothetical protein